MKQTMRLIILALLFLSNIGFAQSNLTELNFDTKYYEAVDKWVAFPKKEADTSYNFGFLYLDQQAGFTFDYLASFIVTEGGLIKLPREFEESLKTRLSPNTIDVAVLFEEQISELELPSEPEWLSIYKTDSNSVSYLKNIGWHYNHAGASNLALGPLLKAHEREPHYDGLEFELAYAYNALSKFDDALAILKRAIQNNPDNFYFYRELGYSYKNLNKIEESEKAYRKGIALSDNDFEKSEMAVNMAHTYFILRNRDNFDEWAKLTRKYAEKGSRDTQLIDLFEEKWDEK